MDKKEFSIIEISPLQDEGILQDAQAREAVGELPAHPGFQYLLAKLRYKRAYLEGLLKTQSHERMRDVDKLQLGIYWTNWLETEVSLAQKAVRQPKREATTEEEELLRQIRSSYVEVGS